MCYLPLPCLKAIVFIGSICSIAISIALLTVTIYVQVEKKDIFSAVNQAAVTGSLVALYLSFILFLLLGVAGLTGSMKGMAKKQNKGAFLLGLYSIGVIVFFAIFLGGTIFFFVGPQAIFGTDCTHGSKTTLVDDLYKASSEADQYFCTNDCPCNIKNQTSYLADTVNNAGGITNGTAQKFGDCTNLNITSGVQSKEILAALENILECAGWCPTDIQPFPYKSYIYRFRNINDCDQQECLEKLSNCHDAFYDFMNGKGQLVGFGCLGAMLVCFINIVAVCCICCHPSKKGSRSNFYSRMIEIQ